MLDRLAKLYASFAKLTLGLAELAAQIAD